MNTDDDIQADIDLYEFRYMLIKEKLQRSKKESTRKYYLRRLHNIEQVLEDLNAQLMDPSK